MASRIASCRHTGDPWISRERQTQSVDPYGRRLGQLPDVAETLFSVTTKGNITKAS
jgi:hypothetical protein